MRILAVLVFLCGLMGSSAYAAKIVAKIDLSQQRMTVTRNGVVQYHWPVSSGRSGYRTPTGTWGVKRMHRKYYSKKYHNAPMPNSIFFHGGYAIHGTNSVKRLGRPASHGCVRLAPGNAKRLFNMVKKNGSRNFRVRIVN